MLYIVAMDMSLGLLQLLAGKTEDATASWLSALSTCHSSHMIMLAAGICRVLLPQGEIPILLFLIIHSILKIVKKVKRVTSTMSYQQLLSLQVTKAADWT